MDAARTECLKEKLTRLYPIVEKSVRRRFANEPEKMSEASSFVSEKLVEDNMRRLALYAPERGASFETYFTVLVQRLISRYIEQNRKKRRFPKWIMQQEGVLWQEIYKQIVWEQWSDEDVVEYLKNSLPGSPDEHRVREVIRTIRTRYPDCGKDENIETSFNAETLSSHSLLTYGSAFHHLSPEDQIAFGQALKLADTILLEPDTDEPSPAKHFEKMWALKNRLREKFRPSSEKRLFLKLIYVEGMSVYQAGRMVGWNGNQASSHHRRLILLLHDILKKDALI